MLLFVIVGLLALGVLIGGIVGGILTGDWRYTIVWAVAMSVFVLCLIVFVLTSLNRAAAAVKDRPPSRIPRAARIVAAGLLIAVPFVVTLVPSFGTISRGTNQSPLTGAYQQQEMDAIAQVVSSHELVDVDFYDDYIIVEAPTKPGADTTDDFQYRYGHAERLGPEMMQPASTKTAQYDGRQVDWSLIPKLIKDAERRGKIGEVTSLHVSVMQSLDPKRGHPPTINVNVEDAYHEAFVQYSPTGKYLSELGSAFDRG